MRLTKKLKNFIIKKYSIRPTDTGSIEVQVAILSSRIGMLTTHFYVHKSDHLSRRGLLKMVTLRRKLLRYTKFKDKNHYINLISDLHIRS